MNQEIKELVRDLKEGLTRAIELSESGVTDWAEYEKLNDLLEFQQLSNLLFEKLSRFPINFAGTSASNRIVHMADSVGNLLGDWGMVQDYFINGIDNVTQEDCTAHLRYMLNIANTF